MLDHLRLVLLWAAIAGVGTTLVLSELRGFRSVSLGQRLRPFAGAGLPPSKPVLATFRQALGPLLATIGEQAAKTLGIRDDLDTRLRRAAFDVDPATYRLRQFGWSAAALGTALLMGVGAALPLPLALLLVLGAPVLVFLLVEQYVVSAADRRRRRLFSELPVVCEQLAMLLSAGYSLGSALNRLAARNHGASGHDLRDVCERVRHGLSVAQALQEWADLVGLAELHRVVSVLSLSSDTGDLGRLVSDEATTIRREAQRRLAETIDKRSQQVWVPVTVATLIPGVTFLIIPFLQALSLFSTS